MEPILNESDQPRATQMVLLVGRYATPLAILLVSAGILFTQPASPVKEISIALLAAGVALNLGTNRFLPRKEGDSPSFIKVRMVSNLAINSALVYVLGGFWGPVWLLLALTPLAAAIYGSRAATLKSALLVSAILVAVRAMRPINSPLDWGVEAVQVAFIVLVSLMVNELAALGRRG